MIANDAPILSQSVRWGENYVSRALNIKLAGIIPSGIYHGFTVKPGGEMTVLIDHEPEYQKSVAVVERDGYSLTVTMEDPGIVKIPASGIWFICIEAYYAPTKQGYQRIVARQEVEAHHVVLASVLASTDKTIITQNLINYGPRNYLRQIPEIINDYSIQLIQNITSTISLSDKLTRESLKRVELQNSLYMSQIREIKNSGTLIRMLDRISNLELALYSGGFSSQNTVSETTSPAGYRTYGGAKVAPVSIVTDGSKPPSNAALVLKIEEL